VAVEPIEDLIARIRTGLGDMMAKGGPVKKDIEELISRINWQHELGAKEVMETIAIGLRDLKDWMDDLATG